MAEQKTIGQIAYDVMRERYPERLPPWGTDHVVCEDYEAAASAVWDQAVEACIEALKENAQIRKEDEADIPGYVFASAKRQHWGQAAESLRSLKRSDKTESGDA